MIRILLNKINIIWAFCKELSLAYNLYTDNIFSATSNTYNKNNNGPNTEPWGTTALAWPTEENCFYSLPFEFCCLKNSQTNPAYFRWCLTSLICKFYLYATLDQTLLKNRKTPCNKICFHRYFLQQGGIFLIVDTC